MMNLIILISLTLFSTTIHAATFEVVNRCSYTVWAAAIPGGGKRLDSGQIWTINVPSGTTTGRIWGRTNCSFDGNGLGKCETGDCNKTLQCQGFGSAPNTLAEYALNQIDDLDLLDISLVDGFNIPMDFSPSTYGCRGIRCAADINGQCPDEWRSPGGCNNACTIYKTSKYCNANYFTKFFKELCPDAYSYPQDDESSLFTAPGGTNYRVTFCP